MVLYVVHAPFHRVVNINFHAFGIGFITMFPPLSIQRFCSWRGLQDRAPGAAAVHRGLGEVAVPRPGSPGGAGAEPVLQPAHHRLHQTVSLLPRGQCVRGTRRGAGAAGGGRRAAAAGLLFPGWRTAQARFIPPGQPAEWRPLEQTHHGLQIRAAGEQERGAQPGSQRATGWVHPLSVTRWRSLIYLTLW